MALPYIIQDISHEMVLAAAEPSAWAEPSAGAGPVIWF